MENENITKSIQNYNNYNKQKEIRKMQGGGVLYWKSNMLEY